MKENIFETNLTGEDLREMSKRGLPENLKKELQKTAPSPESNGDPSIVINLAKHRTGIERNTTEEKGKRFYE
jgi:hypothetical protein